MTDYTIYFYVIIVALIISNLAFLGLFITTKRRQKSRRDSREAEELLLDLLAGESLIKISRISPTDVFLRSPRNG